MRPAPKLEHGMQTSPLASMLNNLFVAMGEAHLKTKTPFFTSALESFSMGHHYRDFEPAGYNSANAAAVFSILCDPLASSLQMNQGELDFSESVAEIGRQYMALMYEDEKDEDYVGIAHPPHKGMTAARKAVRDILMEDKGAEGSKDLAYAQTALYSLYQTTKKSDHNWWGGATRNIIAEQMGIQSAEGFNSIGHFHYISSNQASILRSDFFVQKPHVPWEHEKAGTIMKHEIRPWSIAPLYMKTGTKTVPMDAMTEYMETEAKTSTHHKFTPYFTTIDYYLNSEKGLGEFTNDAYTILGDADIIPLTIGREEILFVHRDLGFFNLRALNWCFKDGEENLVEIEPTNFRQLIIKLGTNGAIGPEVIETSMADDDHVGPIIKFLKWSAHERGESTSVLAHEMKQGKHVVPMSSLNFDDMTMATRIKYGLGVGLVSEMKLKGYMRGSRRSTISIADAILPTRNIDTQYDLYYYSPTEDPEWNKTKYHAPLRVLYSAKGTAPMWSVMAGETVSEGVPSPTHRSEFIPSWKDARKPITVNLGGAPPLGYNHRESRCSTCNGRVILTMPRGYSNESCPCPHCRDGTILIKEVKS